MSDERAPPAADRLPTLTEILELWPQGEPVMSVPEGPAEAPSAPPLDVAALEQRVLAELAQRIDTLFEARLREALAPALARAADGLIRDARAELTPALAEMVSAAVAKALAAPRGD